MRCIVYWGGSWDLLHCSLWRCLGFVVEVFSRTRCEDVRDSSRDSMRRCPGFVAETSRIRHGDVWHSSWRYPGVMIRHGTVRTVIHRGVSSGIHRRGVTVLLAEVPRFHLSVHCGGVRVSSHRSSWRCPGFVSIFYAEVTGFRSIVRRGGVRVLSRRCPGVVAEVSGFRRGGVRVSSHRSSRRCPGFVSSFVAEVSGFRLIVRRGGVRVSSHRSSRRCPGFVSSFVAEVSGFRLIVRRGGVRVSSHRSSRRCPGFVSSFVAEVSGFHLIVCYNGVWVSSWGYRGFVSSFVAEGGVGLFAFVSSFIVKVALVFLITYHCGVLRFS
ncbi:uncharacterized protein LOC126278205 isoform X2 [Schistocerca gregaria]|uniref:uncharacterized protein LOC126278205 isoform X1 n=1 Tax=Schistocerca gregaria TaxID=7010 RepID=UPI00211F3E7A|nr:uncharacterized protein LOC126278205 isoform X1 [Schistocerca gregaria]XP_049834087.1 uncharacterized protein LOC126278205 isoform X1 [Schistocerca gregaria]XP_049834088.1 uncharacterized protein LOC126278205 isoform X1 [Schistocerca gregaria]XP_049834089.1 uncharacterized protein LOC126278205 isoform X2 [Schistocerca gregaria]